MKLTTLLKIPILFCLSFLLLFSCNNDEVVDKVQQEEIEEEIEDDPADFALNFNLFKGEEISIEFLLVKVIDEFEEPIDQVNVSVGDLNGQTDSKGIVLFNNVSAFKNFLTAKITKSDYISTTKTIIPTGEVAQILELTLLKADVIKQINSGVKAEVSTPSGAKVEFKGSYFNFDGSSYTGIVNVSLKHLSPENESTYSNMPGNLLAQDTNGQVKLLETYGMIAVELTGSSGELLNVNADNKATITLPIAVSQQGFSDDSIPLWYFDEEQGIWIEEGSAIKESASYVGEVSHFSWWNCDLPLDLVNMCLTIEGTNGNILPNQNVKIIRNETSQIIYSGLTDGQGKLCGSVPKNELITIQLHSELSCLPNNILFEGVYGKYNNEENDLTIQLNNDNVSIDYYSVTGSVVDCDNNPIVNGIVEINYEETTRVFFMDNTGSLNFGFFGCEVDIATLTAYDYINELETESQDITFQSNVAALGTIKTCSENSDVYVGNIVLASQEELDAFGALGYAKIEGKISIVRNSPIYNPNYNGVNVSDDITSLASLKNLVEVTGDFDINGNSGLTSLAGLENLTTIGNRFYISYNETLSSLVGLEKLSVVEVSFLIRDNNALMNLMGLENVITLNALNLRNNSALVSLEGLDFNNLILKTLSIDNNDALTNLSSLADLSQLDYLSILDNDALISLIGLENLNSIRGNLTFSSNKALFSLTGLENLNSIGGDLYFSRNDALTNLNGLENLVSIGGILYIGNGIDNSIYKGNAALSNLLSLKNLTSLGGLKITGNIALTSLSGLEGITSLRELNIGRNPILTSLSGLEKLVSIENNLVIEDNESLTGLYLEGLSSVGGGFFIKRNKVLNSLFGLNNLRTIGNNITSFKIEQNNALTNFCALSNATINGSYSVSGNLYNPFKNQLYISTECSN
ncbi:hypothetical protein [uncultured Algibacter sp.]|uniref:hypothetical protein n=1 Tax=uncultured Algibacter sp. TaxID=298659 RepID=UPI00260A0176|nr:hypothetical protein [uncultured Algibacter sp.]